MINNRQYKLVPQPGASLVVLIGSYVFFLCVFSLLGGVLLPRFSDLQKGMRILYVLQAVFVFIMPAIIAAITATKLPAQLLAIQKPPRLMPVLLTMIVMLVSIPAMNHIIHWNQNISLPESMGGIEEKMHELETQAANGVQILTQGTSVGTLIMSILIVGVMAGFSEELFFRGALQRILANTSLRAHAAVWLSAVIFSALHLQFFGFVPRLLLGAFFGYLLLWSGTLWLPVIAHIFNNTLATISSWLTERSGNDSNTLDTTGTDSGDIAIVIASALLTAFGIWVLRRNLRNADEKKHETLA